MDNSSRQNQGARKLVADLESVQKLSQEIENSAHQVQNTVTELIRLTEQRKQRSI